MKQEELNRLFDSLTDREKLAEMTQLVTSLLTGREDMATTGGSLDANLARADLDSIGTTLNCFGAEESRRVQDEHLAANPHKIPLLFMADVIHGYRTVFPIPLAMGCSFDLEAARESAEVAARECSAAGVQLTYSPMADLVRDPRWGRVMESTGEDPWLNGQMAAAMVRGYQGEEYEKTGVIGPGHVAACIKHFAAYGASEAGRDYNTVDLSEGVLREYYLPAYLAAVRAGVCMAMTSFNTVDRIPATVNRPLLRGILREENGFDGVVITDYGALYETLAHGACADKREAAKKALEAGVDVEMMSTCILEHGEELMREFPELRQAVDESVRRILALKNALGLFENPYKDADAEKEKSLLLCAEHRAAARRIAGESIVLLKNENHTLPLRQGMKIGIAGPFARSRSVLGSWSLAGTDGVSLFEGLREVWPGAELHTAMDGELGSLFDGVTDVEDRIDEACAELAECDVILAAVGENQNDTGECSSKTDLRLTRNQRRMVERLCALGKPVVLVVFSGRPLEIREEAEQCAAVVQAWFLGTESGTALADVLTGRVNPSGRLSMSFPQTVGQIPVYYNHANTGRPRLTGEQSERFTTRFIDCPNEPLYPFGYGLSYTKFSYRDLRAEQNGDTWNVRVRVRSEEGPEGVETVQLYIRDCSASRVRPVQELRGVQRVRLLPGEEREVCFSLTKDDLSFWNGSSFAAEPGEFLVMAGSSSSHVLSQSITLAD